MDDLNLRVSSVRFLTRRGYDVQADLEQRIDATKQAMRLAYALGAPYVVNQIGQVPSDTESAGWQQLRSSLEDLGRYGAHIGAFLAAETGTEHGADLGQLLDSLQNAFVSVAFNPGQLILGGFPVAPSLQSLGNKVGLLIAQDGVQDLSRGRGIDVPIGQGTADFPEILGALEDWQFRSWVVVGRSSCGMDEVKAGLTYLTNL
jgi:sugar phosphate isomerase/epimerase